MDAQSQMSKDYTRQQEDNVKTQAEAMKLSGAKQSEIMRARIDSELVLLGDRFEKEKNLINLAAEARSKDDREKLSDAAFVADKLKALDSEVAMQQQRLVNDEMILEKTKTDEIIKEALKLNDQRQKDVKQREKEADDYLKVVEKSEGAIAEARVKGAADYQELIINVSEFAATENERAINKITAEENGLLIELAAAWEKGGITYEEMERGRALIAKYTADAILEKETENAKKIADLNYNLIKDVQGYEEVAYNMRIKQIEAQAAADIKNGADRSMVARRVANDTIQAYIDMGKKSDDWQKGVTAAYLELQKNAMTWGEVSYDLVKNATTDMGKAFSSNFHDILRGDFDNLGEAWKTLWDNMLDRFLDILGQMLAEWLVKKALFELGFNISAGGGINPVSAVTGGGGIVSAISSGISAIGGGLSTAGSAISSGISGISASGSLGAAGAAAAPFAAAYGLKTVVEMFPDFFGAAGGNKRYDIIPWTPEELAASWERQIEYARQGNEYAANAGLSPMDLTPAYLNAVADFKSWGWAVPQDLISNLGQAVVDAVPGPTSGFKKDNPANFVPGASVESTTLTNYYLEKLINDYDLAPRYAAGGIITGPTLGIMGEAA